MFMAGDDFPAPSEGFVLTPFIVAEDVARSRDFYVGVLGGTVVLDGEPTIVKLANGWVTINVGGGPTDDKPDVVLEPPSDPNRASAFFADALARPQPAADRLALVQPADVADRPHPCPAPAWRSRSRSRHPTGVARGEEHLDVAVQAQPGGAAGGLGEHRPMAGRGLAAGPSAQKAAPAYPACIR
jgi:hypothetical protein